MHSPIAAHLHVPTAQAVLFVVQRAFDGWIALDLAGHATDALSSPHGRAHLVTRGGPAHATRIFALHDHLDEVALGRALPIGPPRGPRFAFGGNLLHLLDTVSQTALPRLRLFRGLTILRNRDPRLSRSIPATHELVFDTLPEQVRAAFEAESSPTYPLNLTPLTSQVSEHTLSQPVLLDHHHIAARHAASQR